MLNKDNLIFLENNSYSYILGAKIKTFPSEIKEYISNLEFQSDEQTYEIYLDRDNNFIKDNKQESKEIKYRLILSFSTQRMKKDKYLREKHLNKIKEKIKNSPTITKSDLKSPYKKYLDLENINNCNITFKLNKEKVKLDEKLDGIKGYLTNDFRLSHNEIITNYTNLHFIEEAFKISKTDLKIRPIYHRLEDRIKAHILISFVAYAIYRDFTIKIKKHDIKITRKILRDLIKHIFAIKTDDKLIPLKLSDIQQQIYDALFGN